MLIPVVYLDDIDSGSDGAGAADAGEAAAARVATLSHLGLCGPVALLAAADSAVPADPMAVKNCLRAAPCCVGPFVIREGDDSPVEQLLTWLNQGAATALLAPAPADGDETAGSASAEPRDGVDGGAAPSVGSGGALVRVASQLPVERVAVRLRAPAAPAAPGAAALAESTAVGSIRLLASALAELEPHAAAVASVASALVVAVPADCAAAAALLAPGEAVRLLARTVGGEELAAVEALRAAAKALRCEHIGSVAISVERSGAAVAVAPAAVGLLHACGLHVRAPATTEMIAGPDGDAKAPERTEIGASLAACLRSDRPDGLFTTVVTDESGVALGLVYSNELSIRTAVARARGVYVWACSCRAQARLTDCVLLRPLAGTGAAAAAACGRRAPPAGLTRSSSPHAWTVTATRCLCACGSAATRPRSATWARGRAGATWAASARWRARCTRAAPRRRKAATPRACLVT